MRATAGLGLVALLGCARSAVTTTPPEPGPPLVHDHASSAATPADDPRVAIEEHSTAPVPETTADLPEPPEGTPLDRGPAPALAPPADAWVDLTDAVLEHEDIRVTVAVHAIPTDYTDEDGETWSFEAFELRVAVAAASTPAAAVLHLEQPLDDADCDAFRPEPTLLGTFDDGRILVDASLGCDFGEDFSTTTIEHHLLLVDPGARRAWSLYSGRSEGNDEMGVCQSWSVLGFELAGESLVVHRYEGVDRNRDNARDLPADSRPRCRPVAETKTEQARLRLPGPVVAAPQPAPG